MMRDNTDSCRPEGWDWVYPILLVFAVLLTTLTPLVQPDVFWLIKTGEIISQTKSIPHYDIFSYTAMGRPWCDLSWLSALLLWGLYKLGGWNFLIAYKVGMTLVLTYLLFRTFLLFVKSRGAAAWGVIIVLLCIFPRIQSRPHMVTDVLSAFYLLSVYLYLTDRRRSLWILLPLHLIWVNAHLGAIYGIGIVFAFTLGEWLQRYFQDGPAPVGPSKVKHLLTILLLLVAVSLLNPWGIKSLTFPFENVFSVSQIVEYTEEMTPSWSPLYDNVVYAELYRIFLVVMLVSFVLNRKKARLSMIFVALTTAVMAFQASRLVSLFFIVCTPVTFANFCEFRKSPGQNFPAKTPLMLINAGIILNIILFFMWFGLPVRTNKDALRVEMGLGLNPYAQPAAAVDFLEKNDIHGRIFNEMSEGGYLIFRRWPGELVLLDGRTPVFGDDFFRDYINAIRNSYNFAEYLKKYDIDYVLLDATEAKIFSYLHSYLWQSPDWKLAFASPRSYLYLKDVPKFRNVIQRYALKKHPLFSD